MSPRLYPEADVETLLTKFREIIVAVEQERHELKKKIYSASTQSQSQSATGSEGSSCNPASALLIRSPDVGGGIVGGRANPPQRVNINVFATNSDTNTDPTTRTSSTSSSSHAALCTSATRSASSTTNQHSTGTYSSGLLTNSTSRPPSYKTALKPPSAPPEPPIRLRRRRTLLTTENPSILRSAMSNGQAATRGALIVLEGLDRVGKSTLAKKLVEHLQRSRKPVAHQRFPDRSTPVGRLINEFLTSGTKPVDDHTMHLLFSANRWELNKMIRSTIQEGTTVVVDRYSYSGVAYSSAKRNLNMEWCKSTEKGLPKPDLVIYLELDQETQCRRDGFGDERFETKELQELVRRQYEKIISQSCDTWLRVEVDNKSPDQVLSEIIMPVRRCLEACCDKELGLLDFH